MVRRPRSARATARATRRPVVARPIGDNHARAAEAAGDFDEQRQSHSSASARWAPRWPATCRRPDTRCGSSTGRRRGRGASLRPVATAGHRLPHAGRSRAGAAFVVSMVADDAATREVMLGADGVVARGAAGTVIIDSSTNTPAMAREVAAAAAARGVRYLDAPVSGSIAQARGPRTGLHGRRRRRPRWRRPSRCCDAMGRMHAAHGRRRRRRDHQADQQHAVRDR